MMKASHYQADIIKDWRFYWPYWSGYITAIWSFLYAMLGLYWALGGNGFPFGMQNDPGIESILQAVQASTGAPVIVGCGLMGASIALVMTRIQRRTIFHILLVIIAWLIAATLLIIIPDRRVLVAVAYAPVFLVGAPFGWPPVSFLKAIPWPVINQFILILGGGLWASTALAYQRRMDGACVHCGRRAGKKNWTSPEAALRWGRWAVGIAVAVPIVYAGTRWIWALGIPLGISAEMLQEGQAEGMWLAGAALASVAIGGAILTLGLVQKWGENFPRWMIGLAGKRVPLALAIVPASFVAIAVTSAGLAYVRIVIGLGSLAGNWTTMGPELLWPIWGVALAVATIAYYYRRRTQCKYCGLVG